MSINIDGSGHSEYHSQINNVDTAKAGRNEIADTKDAKAVNLPVEDAANITISKTGYASLYYDNLDDGNSKSIKLEKNEEKKMQIPDIPSFRDRLLHGEGTEHMRVMDPDAYEKFYDAYAEELSEMRRGLGDDWWHDENIKEFMNKRGSEEMRWWMDNVASYYAEYWHDPLEAWADLYERYGDDTEVNISSRDSRGGIWHDPDKKFHILLSPSQLQEIAVGEQGDRLLKLLDESMKSLKDAVAGYEKDNKRLQYGLSIDENGKPTFYSRYLGINDSSFSASSIKELFGILQASYSEKSDS